MTGEIQNTLSYVLRARELETRKLEVGPQCGTRARRTDVRGIGINGTEVN